MNRTNRRRLLTPGPVPALLGLALLAGCETEVPEFDQSPDAIAPTPRPAEEVVQTPTPLTLRRLENASVLLPPTGGRRVSMRGGSYEQDAPLLAVTLDAGVYQVADIDEDGVMEAVVQVSVVQGAPGQPGAPGPPGAVGLTSYLVVFAGVTGPPLQEGFLQLPARSQIVEMRIRGSTVELDLLEFRPEDRPCCPSGRRTRRYTYRDGSFNGG